MSIFDFYQLLAYGRRLMLEPGDTLQRADLRVQVRDQDVVLVPYCTLGIQKLHMSLTAFAIDPLVPPETSL